MRCICRQRYLIVKWISFYSEDYIEIRLCDSTLKVKDRRGSEHMVKAKKKHKTANHNH